MKQNEVIQKIIAVFPEIKKDIEYENGLFYMQTSVFCDLAQDAIDTMDRKKFLLVRFVFLNSSGDIKNVLYVSFLEHLNFQDTKKKNRSWAYKIMPKILQEAHEEITKYNEKRHDKMKGSKKSIK